MTTRIEQFTAAHPRVTGGGLFIAFLGLAIWTIAEQISIHRTLARQKKGIYD